MSDEIDPEGKWVSNKP